MFFVRLVRWAFRLFFGHPPIGWVSSVVPFGASRHGVAPYRASPLTHAPVGALLSVGRAVGGYAPTFFSPTVFYSDIQKSGFPFGAVAQSFPQISESRTLAICRPYLIRGRARSFYLSFSSVYRTEASGFSVCTSNISSVLLQSVIHYSEAVAGGGCLPPPAPPPGVFHSFIGLRPPPFAPILPIKCLYLSTNNHILSIVCPYLPSSGSALGGWKTP